MATKKRVELEDLFKGQMPEEQRKPAIIRWMVQKTVEMINAANQQRGAAIQNIANGNGGGRFASIFGQNKNGSPTANVSGNFPVTSRNMISAGAEIMDPRRDIDAECGYPPWEVINPDAFRRLYDREPIASRVVELYPKECWQVQPEVYEDENPDNVTAFEDAWDKLSQGLRGTSWHQDSEGNAVWEYLLRLDILSGIGTFGALLLGIQDGKTLEQPVDGAMADLTDAEGRPLADMIAPGTDAQYVGVQLAPDIVPPRTGKDGPKLMFLRPFSEDLVQIVRYEANIRSPRFGQPIMYRITLNDPRQQHSGVGLPMATVMVHWSRVIHVADNQMSSEIFGIPRMQPVLNRLLDLIKLYGGSGEMYWRGAFPGMNMTTAAGLHPADIDIPENLPDIMEQYFNGLQRYLVTPGFNAQMLSPTVVGADSQINAALDAICIKLGVPKRVFMGSERGELASSQDDSAWNDRLRERQHRFITPRIIVPFIDRLIAVGVLPEPAAKKPKKALLLRNARGQPAGLQTVGGYSVKWPDLDSLSDKDIATIAAARTTAMATFVSGNCEAIMTLMDFYVRVLGYTQDEAAAIIDAVEDETPDDRFTPEPPEPTPPLSSGGEIGGEEPSE